MTGIYGKVEFIMSIADFATLIMLVWRMHKVINILGMSAFIWCKKVSKSVALNIYYIFTGEPYLHKNIRSVV